MKYLISKKLLSFVLIMSLSGWSIADAFMKMNIEQTMATDGTLQVKNYMDMSGILQQFEKMGLRLDDLPPEQKKELDASLDQVCEQMETEMLRQLRDPALLPAQRQLLQMNQDSFFCQQTERGKFEITVNSRLLEDQYSLKEGLFIFSPAQNNLTPALQEQLNMLSSQKLSQNNLSNEQITQLRELGIDVKMVFVFPGKVQESSIGKVYDNKVEIDIVEEIIAMLESGTEKGFLERFMNIRIISAIDKELFVPTETQIQSNQSVILLDRQQDSVLIKSPAREEKTEIEAVDNPVQVENITDDFLADLSESDLEVLLQSLESESTTLPMDETMSEEDLLLALLEFDDEAEFLVETPLLPTEESVLTEIKPTNTTKVSAPLASKDFALTIDPELLEETVINNVFSSSLEEAPVKQTKLTYSPNRIVKNIQDANTARQAKKSSTQTRYLNFFRQAAR